MKLFRLTTFFILLFLLLTGFVVPFSTAAQTEDDFPKMNPLRHDWKNSEAPAFEIKYPREGKIFKRAWNFLASPFQESGIAEAVLLPPFGDEVRLEEGKDYSVTGRKGNERIEINKDLFRRTGKYELRIMARNGEEVINFSQDFTWGVLALNSNKSLYLPGETGKISMAVLNEKGEMVCDAYLALKISNEKLGINEELSTENGRIKVNQQACQSKDFTLEADYESEYQWGGEGVYELNLVSETANGTYEITDQIEVRKKVSFDVERLTATRIFPSNKYPVTFNILANENFEGEIREAVPANFEVSQINQEGIKEFDEERMEGGQKILTWRVEVKKGEKIRLGYRYDAPDVSPEFYLLGPLQFVAQSRLPFFGKKLVFEEARQWQIASDAVGFIGSVSNQATNGANVTLTLSGLGLQEDDLVIVAYSIGDNDNTDFNMVETSGTWTEVADLFSNDTYEANLGVYWKVMGSTPDTSVVVDGLGGTDSGTAAVAMAFRGVDTTTPMDVTPTTATGINTMHPDPPSINHNNPSGIWTVIAGASGHAINSGSYTFPSNYTTNKIDRYSSDTSDATVGMGYRTNPSDPEDPGTMTHSGTDSANYAWAAVTLALKPAVELPGIAGSLGKSADGWAGAVPVYGTLTGGLSQGDYPYARAQVTTIASQTFYTDMTWDSGDGRFEGVIYPGSNICMGCDDPKTYNGSFSVTVQLDNDSGFGSVDYSDSAGTFTTAITLKRTSMNNVAAMNYTDFNAIWDTNHWNVSIDDFGFAMLSGTGTNIAVAIPIHPETSSPSNFAVSYNGTSVSQGSAESTSNAWWYNSSSHTLYLQFASLTTTLVDVDIDFDSDTDLFATRYNWTYSYDMGSRRFSNGLYIANKYLTTFYYGKPFNTTDNNVACSGNECENTGMQAESRAHEDGGPDESTDCMERVAVHVDDTALSDGTTYYQYDIKWKQSETPSWITSENNSEMVLVTNSDDTASTGWAQQLDNSISAKRTQTYYSQKRYIKNFYEFTNNDSVSHKYPLVWEREQWHGEDRATNDAGRFQGDTTDRIVEERIPLTGFTCPWQTAYDTGTFINMGMVYDTNDLPDYGIFGVEPFLAPTAYEWPITITEDHATNTADQTGFEKTFSSVAASETVDFTFYHVHNAESSWANIETAMNADCAELNTSEITVSGGCFTDDTEGTACTDDAGDQIKVAVNGVVEANADTTVDDSWSFTINKPANGATLVFFRDGETTESKQATTVTKYDGSDNVDLVKMYEGQLVLGTDTGSANSAQTISIADLNTTNNGYEYSDDPDVLFDVTTGNDLDLNLDSQLNSLYVIGGNTYQPASGGGGDTTARNFKFEGTLTLDNNILNLSGNFTNAGTLTANTATINFNGSTAQNFVTNGATYNTLTLNNSGADGTDDNITISGALDVNGAFNLTNGDLVLTSGNPNVNTAGDVTIGSSAYVTKGTGTWTFDGSSQIFTDSTSGQDLGAVSIGPSTTTSVSTSSNLKVTSLTLGGNDTLNISSDTLTLTGSGTGASRPFVHTTGTFTVTGSTVKYTGTSASDIQEATYNNLELSPSGGSTPTYALATAGSKTITTQNLTIGNGVNGVSVSASTNNPILDVNGDFLLNASGSFTGGSSNITVGTDATLNGDFTLESGSTWTAGSGTLILDGGDDTNLIYFNDKNGTKQNLGNVQIGASPATTNLSSDMSATNLTIASGDRLKTRGYDITLTGYLTCNGTLNVNDTTETDDTYITLAGNFTMASGATFTDDDYDSEIVFTGNASANQTFTTGGKTYGRITVNNTQATYDDVVVSGNLTANGTSVTVTDGNLDLETNDPVTDVAEDVSIGSSGTLTASSSSAFYIAGSWSNSGTLTPGSGTITFDSADTGETINAGGTGSGKVFSTVVFNNSAGGWTIQTSDMKTANLTLTDVSSWELDASRTLEVTGTYTLTGSEASATTWDTSSVFYLNGTSQTIGSKTQSAETYATLQVGANTDIRMWQSSATTYTVDSSGSLYSQDHANTDGDLYIWGDYHVNTNDYWSYANDFDNAAVTRQVDVRIDPAAKVTVDSGDALNIIGDSSNRTTVSRQGSSNGYELVCDGGTINIDYTDFDYLDGPAGLDIRANSTVTKIDHSTFENLIATAGTDSNLTVVTSVIGTGTKTLTGNSFTLGAGDKNAAVTGTDVTGYWDFDGTNGEADDWNNTTSANEADPGMLRWDNSNTPPTLNVDNPATDTDVADGSSYNIQYDLSDTEDTATVDFYYETDGNGTGGTAISACQDEAEGTDATCSFNPLSEGMSLSTYYYIYGVASDGVNPDVTDVSTGRIRVNDAPTLTVSEPNGTGDTIAQNGTYTSITYDLADTDDVVTVDFYYDTDGSGLDGVAIAGCQDKAEATGGTCNWDTTGISPDTYYIYGIVNDGVNGDVSDYSPGEVTINSAPTLTISRPPVGNTVVPEDSLYDITYTLADPDDVVTVAFYYDTDDDGSGGTPVTGCGSEPEETNGTCSFDTSVLTLETPYYIYGVTSGDSVNGSVTTVSSGTLTASTVIIHEPYLMQGFFNFMGFFNFR